MGLSGVKTSLPRTLSLQVEEAEPILFSALQVYSPMSALVALLSFRLATPFEYSNLQLELDRTLPSALNQDTLISGVPATWHFRHTASPAVTSMGSRDSTKYGGSVDTMKHGSENFWDSSAEESQLDLK